jgi:hypothetical protein
MARSMPRIYAIVDGKKFDHQYSVVEMEGMITSHLVSILIDPGSNLSYVATQAVGKCKIQPHKHSKPWLVQLATGTKIKVEDVIPSFQFAMDGFSTQDNLNMIPVGSYDLLFSMEWLVAYKTKLYCYHKSLECVNEEGRKITLQGIQTPVSMR